MSDDGSLRTRWAVYAVLIVISTGMMLARVARVRSADPKNPTPFLSANDRSRWATIRSLGDNGTYAIERIIFDKQGNRVRGWHTIDLVRHRGPDQKEHYYSSKPTLLTTLLAGEYWLIKAASGATLGEQTEYVARMMLVLTNVLPLAISLLFLAQMLDGLGRSDWSRFLAVGAACFATFLTTFAVTLNNHLIAAVSLVVALSIALPLLAGNSRAWWRFAAAGLAFGFVAANELPALSLLVLAGLALAWRSPLRTAVAFVPAALFVAAAALGTNYLAHGDWRTPYAHRQDGPVITTVEDEWAVPLHDGIVPTDLVKTLREKGVTLSEQPAIVQRIRGERWDLWDEATQQRLALVRTPEGAPQAEIEVRRWDNWYDYEGTYWTRQNVRGIDRGEPSPAVYAFHVLLGHHGLFSLTPLWMLSAAGCVLWLARTASGGHQLASGGRQPSEASDLEITKNASATRFIAAITLLTTIVVVGFYLTRPQLDRNYGGGTCCLRWLVWLTPLWLLTLLPALDWLGRMRWGRMLALTLLLVSVFSAHYAADNPWSHPWIFDYWTAMGWIKY